MLLISQTMKYLEMRQKNEKKKHIILSLLINFHWSTKY